MDEEALRSRLTGCYVTVPTMFHDDPELSVDLEAIRRHVRFLIEGGLTTGNAVLLAGGAAGDFSTMTLDERIAVASAVTDEVAGRAPVAMGGQTTSTRELRRLVEAAADIGVDFVQVSPPFYFGHTEDDFYEYVLAADAAARSRLGLIIYNTYWTSVGCTPSLVERLVHIPSVVGLKWSTPDTGKMVFEQIVSRYGRRFAIIDNQMRYVTSHILGARAIEVHVANYWPQWAVREWQLLEAGDYVGAQRELVRVAMPFMELWAELDAYTGGDGFLDKLCMELIGLDSSRCRPPTRDIRDGYRAATRAMLLATGVPGVVG
jgi:dihydrodipicolinate synthase/N-acetylneuraminate lyase